MKRSLSTVLSGIALSVCAAFTAPAASAETVYMVQLGSFKSDQEAQDHWNDLSQKFPDMFHPLTYAPAEVMLPPDGAVYHRTQAGPVPTKQAADSICERVTASGSECYVVETAMLGAPDEASARAASEPSAAGAAAAPSSQSTLFDASAEQAPYAPADVSAAPDMTPSPVTDQRPITVLPSANVAPPAPPAPPPAAAKTAPAAFPFSRGPSIPDAPAPAKTSGSRLATMHGAAYVPPTPASAAPVPVAGNENAVGNGANVRVAEAIRVPLSDPRLSGMRSPYDNGPRGVPGSYNRFVPYWAEIGYFNGERDALGYWSVLRQRDPLIPGNLRLRITQPFRAAGMASKMSLNVGPFGSVDSIRRLCGLTRAEHLGCRAVRDLGGSVNYSAAPAPRAAAPRSTPAVHAPAIPFGAPTPAGGGFGAIAGQEGTFWVQLGTFMASEAAQDKWTELKSRNPEILARLNDQVYAPPGNHSSFRLRAGPFSRQAEAAATCNALKQTGTLCLVVAGF